MRLNVKQLSGDQFFVDVEATDLVSTLKSKIEDIINVESGKQRLIFSARELIDSSKLSDYPNLVDGKTIHLVIRRHINIDIDSSSQQQQQQQHASSINNASSTSTDALSQPLRQEINHNISNDDVFDDDGVRMIDVMEMSRACRLIKIFALIDCALMIVFAIYNPYFLIGVPLALCGFIGAKKLQRIPLFIYGFFILLSIAFRIFLAYEYFSWLMVALSVVSVLLELYILRQTVYVFRKIPLLSVHDHRMLQELSQGFV